MSEPSDAEVAKHEDMRLDGQIDELMEEKHRQGQEDLMATPDEEPTREAPALTDEEDHVNDLIHVAYLDALDDQERAKI